MKSNEVKILVYTTIVLAGLLWGGILLVGRMPLISYESLKALNMTAVTIAGLWAMYFTWGWRWPYVRRIIFRPDLNGSWIGEFWSDWKDPTGNGIPPGLFVLVVRQSFFTISIRAYTEKQKTLSYVESLVLDGERGTKILGYLYSEKRVRSGEHNGRQGAADLELVEETNRRILEGDFWTHSGTTGFVRVAQASPNYHVESFDQATTQWPIKELWATVQCENPAVNVDEAR
jgi:hypothetical protein